MKLYSTILIGTILFAFSLQADMKISPEFSLELPLESGVKIYDTGKGWLFTSEGTDKFPVKIVSITDTGDISWERTFAYPTSHFIPHAGGAYFLDVNGNFFEVSRTGSVEHNLTAVVPPGRNLLAKSQSGLLFATGGDDTITSFMPDGNIEWMVPANDSPMSLYSWNNALFVSDKSGKLTKYTADGEISWQVDLKGFAPSDPAYSMENNMVFGTRDSMGKEGYVYEITPDGEILWESRLGHGVNEVITAGEGYLAVGPLAITSLESDGKIKWYQPFEKSKKLFPLGFDDDGRLILGILNADKESDSIKLTLLDWSGRISVITKIPVKTNKLVNVSLRGRLLFIGDRDEIQVFRLITMKEYLDEMNK